MISDEEGNNEFESGEESLQLEDPLLLVHKCASCSAVIRDEKHESASTNGQNTKSIHSMLSETFYVPNGTLNEEGFLCCSSCSTLIDNMSKGVQALKQTLAKNSTIHSFFEAFEKHMEKFLKSGIPHEVVESSLYLPYESTASPIPLVLDVSPVLIPKTTKLKKQTRTSKPISESTLPTYIITSTTPLSLPFGAIPNDKEQPNSTMGTSTDTFLELSFPRIIKTEIPQSDSMPNLLVHYSLEGTSELSYPDAAITSEERKLYRNEANVSSQRFVDCPAPYCAKFFTGPVLGAADTLMNQHMTIVHPTFVCCRFCDRRVYGLDANMATELLHRHETDQHKEEEGVINDDEGIIAYPLGSKIYTYNCQFCPRKFHGSDDRHRALLKKTCRSHHNKVHAISLQCTQCTHVVRGTPGNIQSRMDKHVKSIHVDQDIACRICQKPFISTFYLRKHEFTHCSAAEKEAELQKDPSILTSTLCPICGIVLQGYFNYEHVLLTQHKNRFHPDPEDQTKKKQKKVYYCDKCDYSVVQSRRSFEQHRLIHEESDSPYFKNKCKRCGMGFRIGQGREYKAHTMVCCDESDRPIVCTEPDCVRRFKTKQNLMIHLIGYHKQTPEAARAFLYPGLPIHGWIRGIKKEPKRKKAEPEDHKEDGISEMKAKIPRFHSQDLREK